MSFAPHFSKGGACIVPPITETENTAEYSFRPAGSQRCVHGRVIATDIFSDLDVCECQMAMSFPSYTSRVPSLPDALYGTVTSHLHTSAGLLGAEPSAFYPMKQFSRDGLKSTSEPFNLHTLLPIHPYGSLYPGPDVNNAARRKNATRETTSALKAWLYEHQKNPYPTKGEKIMLAIITRMTLTQVSTWFANARRRLKKETKMGWSTNVGMDDSECDDSEKDENGGHDSSSCRCSTPDKEEILNVSDVYGIDNQMKYMNNQTSSEHLQTADDVPYGRRYAIKAKSRMDSLKENIQRECHVTSNNNLRSGHLVTQTSSSNMSTPGRVKHPDFVATGTANCRPKIWSISEIIGSKNDFPNTLPMASESVFSSMASVESTGSSTVCQDSCSRSGTDCHKRNDDESRKV